MIAAALIGGTSASSNGGWDGSAIYWTATGMSERYVLDVNGFANEVPKKMMLWRRDGSTPNGNEYFKYVNGAIMWQTDGTSTWLCLEADGEPFEPGARLQMNYCSGGATQTWQLKGTATAQIDSFKIELKSFPGRCVGIADNKGANYQTVQLGNCDNDSQISFVAAGWKADPDTPPAPAPPVPPPAPTGTPCDRAQSDPCYSKFQCGAGDFKCRCVNGPGTDPSKFTWYQWVCGQGLSVAFMDSSCHKCNGLIKNGKVQPCPCHYTNGNVTIAV